MERKCPLCKEIMPQYPAIQKCGKCSEIIIPESYMYFLINQQQISCNINCGWSEIDENNIVDEYLNNYCIDINLINNIIKSNLFVLLSENTLTEYFTLTKKKYSSNEDIKRELLDKLRKLSNPYSSNILTFNIFEYWRQKNEINRITESLGLNFSHDTKMFFEKSLEIDTSKTINPHLDIFFENSSKGAGVECKFSESFNRNYPIIKWDGFYDYIKNDTIWIGLDNLKIYSNNLYLQSKQNKYFNVKQSICHILSLHKHFNGDKDKYCFIYLFYSSLFKNENMKYIEELNDFANCLKNDGIQFFYKTYDEIIKNLSKNANHNDDINYFIYIKNRYFLLKDYFLEIVKNF